MLSMGQNFYECCIIQVFHFFVFDDFSIDGFRPTICRIISSISSDLDCVQHFSNGVCDENALEVLSPMQSETSHVYSQLKCDSCKHY